MRCLPHKAEAIAICSYCGRAVCDECAHSIQAARITCSEQCVTALTQNEIALQAMLQQGRQNAKASAFYCYLCGALSAIAAVTAWFMLPSPFLILFTGGCAAVLTASGVRSHSDALDWIGFRCARSVGHIFRRKQPGT
jgi:hypothetical protein